MNGRRIYHARGKVLGGSSSINGMIFQRGNPLDYERWAPIPGWRPGTTPIACPTSSGWRTASRPNRDDPFRGHGGPLGLERGPATNPLFSSVLRGDAGGRLPADRRRQRLPPGGLRAVRPEHPPRSPAQRRAGLPPPGHEAAEPQGRTRTPSSPGSTVRWHAGPSASRSSGRGRTPRRIRGRRGHPRRRRDQLAAAPPAVRRRQRDGARARSGSRSSTTCPASASISRTTSRSTSSTEHEARLDAAGPRQVAQAMDRVPVAVLPPRPGRDEPLRGRRLRPQQRRGRLPEPDVPLPAAGDPLRRHGAEGRPRLPGPRRADVLRRPRLGEDHLDRPGRSTRRSASTTSRPTRIGASGSRRSAWRGGSWASRRWPTSTVARRRLARAVETDERDPRLGRARRGDGAPSVVHGPDGHRRRCRSRIR